MNDANQSSTPVVSRRGVLISICGCHLLHDGLADVIYVFLPFWRSEFDCTHAQLGVIVSLYFAALAVFQIPAGLLAERIGERRLLVAGTVVAGAAFLIAGRVHGIISLTTLLIVSGIGSSVQHPLGASLVAQAYGSGGRRIAIGTYNFAGDLGKVLFPVIAGVALLSFAWPSVMVLLGAIALIGSALLLVALRWMKIGQPVSSEINGDGERQSSPSGEKNRRGFALLSCIGVIDTMTRYGLLTLLPFLLIERGQTEARAGMALGLLFAGGAAGKFLCGWSAQRFGAVATVWFTETLTCVGIVALLYIPNTAMIFLLPVLGAALNGTSSVLYGAVADFVSPDRQARAFGVFYTIVIAASAAAPAMAGALSDATTLSTATYAVAGVALLTLPLSKLLDWR
ncbi:MAG: MFS transporter [Pirellulaceae bacterium]|jgi:MFS family permease|nr:MFS transporter [Pirellulaceae bacterium]MDP7018990.1 MFS transporter [Pirellulaceae bacterium]